MAAAMPRENPFEVIIEQPGQRLRLLLPGVLAEITKRVKVVVDEAPRETVAREEATVAPEVNDASLCVSRHRDSDEIVIDL